ncbi:MAG TPA: hypothetical protein VLJ57_13465 [Burkholderiaceae bacterium]|nr:hypothetical protein [Burkholderiaceae bacterium]
MNELLDHPAVQGGVAPFVAGLLFALVTGRRAPGLAIVAGFAVAVGLALGWQLLPLSSTRKLVWVGVVCAFVVLVQSFLGGGNKKWRAVSALGAAAAVIWVLLGVLQQRETAFALGAGLAAAAFVGALVTTAPNEHDPRAPSMAALVILGWSAGALALLGASASLALLAIATGAAAAAVLLLALVGLRISEDMRNLALPVCVLAGSVACVSSVTGAVPWFALLPLLAVTWMPRLRRIYRGPAVLEAGLGFVLSAVPAGVSIALAFFFPHAV